MSRLEGIDRRHYEIVPDSTVKGESVLALFVASIKEGRYVKVGSWTFAEVNEALERYESVRAQR